MYSGGDGTAENPYLIKTEQDLSDVRFNMDKHFKQIANITCKNPSFLPLNYLDESLNDDTDFTGTYDGNNKQIRNLKITTYNGSLFGYIGNRWNTSPTVHHLDVVGASIITDISEWGYAAILSTYVYGIVEDCYVSGTAEGGYVGGFCTNVSDTGKVRRCGADVKIKAVYAGGFVCYIDGYSNNVEDCYVHGEIHKDEHNNYGEIASFSYSPNGMQRCYTTVKTYNTPAYEPMNSLWHDGLFSYLGGDSDLYDDIRDCYIDVEEGGPQEPWHNFYGYTDYSSYVRGTDGQLYTCINYQNYYDDFGNPGIPEAEPPNGSLSSRYWELSLTADSKVARNTEFFKDPNNFVNWDFENVWQIKPGDDYPTHIRRSKGQLEAMPLTSITVVD